MRTGSECGADDVGELFSNSPYLFNGYWQRPEAKRQKPFVTAGSRSEIWFVAMMRVISISSIAKRTW